MNVSHAARERITRLLKGEADAVPILAQINEHVVKLCGGDIREAYTNAEKFVEMNLAVFEYYQPDMPGFYYDIYNIEAEALGQRLNWEADRMPDIDRQNPWSGNIQTWTVCVLRISKNRAACLSYSKLCDAPTIWDSPCGFASALPFPWR